MEKIRVALVHDWLTGQRGGEKVLEALAEIFPDAPIYTLFHFPGSQAAAIEKKRIETSFLQRMPFLRRHYRWYLPLYPVAVELFDLRITTSSCRARIAWPKASSRGPRPSTLLHPFARPLRLEPVRRLFLARAACRFSPGRRPLRHPPAEDLGRDLRARAWTTSSRTRGTWPDRIEKYYRRTAEVIHPPVDTEFFRLRRDRAPARLRLDRLGARPV